MDSNARYCIIIDSFRSHNSLAYLCNEYKIAPIHIFSSAEIFEEQFSAVVSAYFFKSFIFKDFEKLKYDLLPFIDKTLFCFSCTDSSQVLKEQIDDYFNLPQKNNIAFSKIKNNKYQLYQHLNQISDNKNFSSFVKKHGPSIVKPAPVELSSGCLNVNYVTDAEIEDKDDYFISKYFNGEEYAVDIVSSNGKHKLCAAWKYIRNNNQKIWKNKVELLSYKDNQDLIKELYDKCVLWLNSVEHKHGPCHIEIKHNGDEFFCVEINFRLNGHMSFAGLYKCFGVNNQVSLTLNSFTRKDLFTGELQEYQNNGYISRIYFCNDRLRNYSDVPWKAIELISSVVQVFKHVYPWELLPISSQTYQSTSAIIILYNQSYDELLVDEEKLRTLLI